MGVVTYLDVGEVGVGMEGEEGEVGVGAKDNEFEELVTEVEGLASSASWPPSPPFSPCFPTTEATRSNTIRNLVVIS